ncbi:MAG: hypothetical protein ACK5NQ_10140 [Pseudomonas sp.]
MFFNATSGVRKRLISASLGALFGFTTFTHASSTQPSSQTAAARAQQVAQINNFTNNDWLKGIWRKSAGLSVPATNTNRTAFKPGASIKLADGQIRTIAAVYFSGNNMSLMLNGANLNASAVGYPKTIGYV